MVVPAQSRLVSLDAFRGFTIAAMLLVNNPGRWSAVYPQLEHAEWHGWTFTDTIFPFFLWITGLALTLSFAKRLERGDTRGKLMVHVLRRSALIFLVGLLLNGFPYYRLDRIRIPGVLQRIAVCYLFAAAIFLFLGLRGCMAAIVVLLTSYWVLMMLAPVPGLGPGHFEKGANFANYVDGVFLQGHMWSQTKTWDPEGIVSTLPSIATALFGVLAGYLVRAEWTPAERTAWLLLTGNSLVALAHMLSVWMPFNKSLWTAPYTILMAGLASITFAFWYWIVDVHGRRRWVSPFVIFGMNAIIVYALSGVVARLLGIISVRRGTGWVSLGTLVYDNVFAPLASPVNASLLYAIAHVLLLYAIAFLMHRRGWFVRL